MAFTGGGTAGHVFPGLAVAEALGRRILWIGSSEGPEGRLVAAAGVDFRRIPAGKLRRYLSLRNVSDVARTIAGVLASIRILRRERPAFLFSKGGFVSVPAVAAAWLCGIPSWTHESDFDPGLATRINLRFCEKVLVSCPETVGYLPARYRGKAIVTGNPVRAIMYRADAARGRRFVGCDGATPMLLVLGGSQGSTFINGLVASSLPSLLPSVFVVHQLGPGAVAATSAARYFPTPFFGEELADVMAAADLVVSRAGANTLAELAALAKPSLLIPLSRSGSRGDQIRNARVYADRGASLVMEEAAADPVRFAAVVTGLIADRARMREMGARARSLGEGGNAPGAPGRPAEMIAALIRRRLA